MESRAEKNLRRKKILLTVQNNKKINSENKKKTIQNWPLPPKKLLNPTPAPQKGKTLSPFRTSTPDPVGAPEQ